MDSSSPPPKGPPRNGQKKNFDGVQAAAEMLNHMDPASQEKMLRQLEARDPQMAQQIRQRMFTFEDLMRSDPLGFQQLLREISPHDLRLAMRMASEAMKAFIYGNMSSKAAQLLREEVEGQGPQKQSDVTAAQQAIVEHAKKFLSAGKLKLSSHTTNR